MSSNAMWWVHYHDANRPEAGERLLTLSSADLVDVKKAHKRARETAKARLARKGIMATGFRSQCVG